MVFNNKSHHVIRIIQVETQLIYETHMQYNNMKTNANIHYDGVDKTIENHDCNT